MTLIRALAVALLGACATSALVAPPRLRPRSVSRAAPAPARVPAPRSPSSRVAVAVFAADASGLPDPTFVVAVFAALVAALAWTQFDMVQVVTEEDIEGAEGARRARDALARKRGYFRK